MADATTIQANITNLENAMVTGEKRVEVNGEMIVYQDTDKMLLALNYFRQQLAAQPNSANPAPGVTLATFGRG